MSIPIAPGPGPRDWSPPGTPQRPAGPQSGLTPPSRTGRASNLGWKIATLILGISTIVLAIMLVGFTSVAAAPRTVIVAPPASPNPSSNPTTSGTPTSAGDVANWVGGLVFAVNSVYSKSTGWPSELSEGTDGKVRDQFGQILGSMPLGVHFGYALNNEFGSYTITAIVPTTFEVIVYSSADDRIVISR